MDRRSQATNGSVLNQKKAQGERSAVKRRPRLAASGMKRLRQHLKE